MRKSMLAVVIPVMLFSSPVIAQQTMAMDSVLITTNEGKSDEGKPGDGQADVTIGDIAEQAQKVYSDWKNLGWMYGIIAAIGLLVLLLRFKPINEWLENSDLKKYKPVISMALGALTGFFTAWAESGLWPDAVIALAMGMGAGLAAVGGHQVLTKGNTK